MQDKKVKTLALAIANHHAEKKRKGKASAAKVNAIREAFRLGMNDVIARKMRDKREEYRRTTDLFEQTTDEGFLDGLKAIGHAASHAVGHAVADGLGVSGKSVSKVITAFRKKKKNPYDVSKVPTRKKPVHVKPAAPAHDHSNNVVHMDRKEFSKKLKASGNNLRKVTSLS